MGIKLWGGGGCSVTVEDETGPIESMQIPCGGTYYRFCTYYKP